MPKQINSHSIAAMSEIGIDITQHQSGSVDTFDLADFDIVVTLYA